MRFARLAQADGLVAWLGAKRVPQAQFSTSNLSKFERIPVKFYAALARCLHEYGTEVLFALTGDGNVFFCQDFANIPSVRLISASHEAGALSMAYGYWASSGRLGVASVTHGPGLSNSVTGLIEGVKASASLVLICGDTAATDPTNAQNIDQQRLVGATGAGFVQVRTPGSVQDDLRSAIMRAEIEHRPIVLNVPADFTHKDVDYQPVSVIPTPKVESVIPQRQLEAAIALLTRARQPVILAGRGARDAGPRLERLAERIDALTATTVGGKDTFGRTPYNLGVIGASAAHDVTRLMRDADCIISFGASLNRYTTAAGSLIRNASLVCVDNSPTVLALNSEADVRILGDSGQIAEALLTQLEDKPPVLLTRRAVSQEQVDHSDPDLFEKPRLEQALKIVDQAVPDQRVLVTDAGRFIAGVWQHVHAPGPSSFVSTLNFAAIGLGMGAAVGAAQSSPSRPVLLVTGDGGFMLGGLGEFNTAVRYAIDLIVVVCNDSAYGAELTQLKSFGLPTAIAEFHWPDLADLAVALGGEGLAIRRAKDLAKIKKFVSQRTGPILIDIKLDPDAIADLSK